MDGPRQVTVYGIDQGVTMRVYRIVRTEIVDDPMMLNSFRSHFALGEEPRRVERQSALMHMGISVYTDPSVARGTAERFPKLGDYIAEVNIDATMGVDYARTGHPLHLTLWADPVKLCAAVADIEPV
ncbi:MAG: hypothetical protein M3370_00955 [Actinomycetota bacterium]|nr:hypothetical protein [Actinomycetota bacterium]